MRKYGLIGRQISHSFSPGWFKDFWRGQGISDCSYDLFPCDTLTDVENLLKSDKKGFNVTIPFKKEIIPLLNQIDPDAWKLGAVNTLARTSKHSWKGFNTDMPAFRQTIIDWYVNRDLPKKALILGNGGSALSVRFALESLNMECSIVARDGSGDLTFAAIGEHLEETFLIVQCTPVGMTPEVDKAPEFPFQQLTPEHRLYDLIYNPAETLFLAHGKQMGAVTRNGLDMLKLQARLSWSIWESGHNF